MRPVELTVDGFRSYGKPATFTWSDRGLVGVVGPIGSGKSSILDAIAFALYARVPAFERDVKRLINQRRDECHVGLVFDVDGRRFAVERAMRRKGAAGHVLREIVDGDSILVSDKAKEIGEHVEELLGLDFDAFRRSVLLAQNRFAEFLQATPAQRDAVLEGVFPRFGRIAPMRDRGKALLGLVAARLETATMRRRDLASDREALEAATERRKAEDARLANVQDLVEPMAALDARIAEAAQAARKAEEDLARLTRLSKDVPARDRSEPILRAAADADAVVSAAESAERDAAERLDVVRTALEQALAAAGGRDGLSEADRLLERLDAAEETATRETERAAAVAGQAAAAATAVDAATERLDGEAARHVSAVEAQAAAAQSARTAEEALHTARHGAMAATLRSGLSAGDPCPVCEQAVAHVPEASDPLVDQALDAHEEARAALEAASGAVTAAAAAEAAARQALEAAQEAATAAAAQASGAEKAAATAAERVGEIRSAVAGLLGDADPAVVLEQRKAAVRAAEEQAAAAEAKAKEAVQAAVRAREGSRNAAEALNDLVRRLARLAGTLGLEVEVDPGAIEGALVSIREGWLALKAEADEAAAAAERVLAEAREERGGLLSGAGLPADADVADAVGAARATLAATDREIEGLHGRLRELRDLEAREADTLSARDRLERIVDDLAPSKFLRFVLDEKRRALAALGSERLEELSGGRYRFTDDGGFEIVDLMAAEQPRPAASLSGGETFLASLALALALAEMVGREGGRLDAFFLDEGFGSLDPEHIDLAMDGIERLVAGDGDRLVVVVSHVPALRDRIEDLVVLDKDVLTGDTVVRRGAAPGEG